MTPKAGSISSIKQLGKQSDWSFIKIRSNFMAMTLTHYFAKSYKFEVIYCIL